MIESGIYAKDTRETLADHTIRCLHVADIVLQNLPFEPGVIEKITKDLRLAIAVHDTGKAATGFQKSLFSAKPWGHRHEILSTAFASAIGASEEVLLAVITHHKPLPSDGIFQTKNSLPYEEIPWPADETPIWKDMADEWTRNLALFKKEWTKICSTIGRDDLSNNANLTPIKLDKSWIKRSKQAKVIPYEKRYHASLLRGLLITCDHIGSNTGLDIKTIPRVPTLKEYNLGSYTLRGFQKQTEKIASNLILRAPTGSGKTLAALLWAQTNQKRNGRLFYVLPNIASINSMFLQLRDYFGENVGILHSKVASYIYSIREGNDDISKLKNQSHAREVSSLAREMWYPIRVCTPHQILRYSLQGKGWEAMLSEFPNSCFIFDEIHAYDPTITGLTIATAKNLVSYNASCLFLSATLPKFLKKIIEDNVPSTLFLEPVSTDESDRKIMEQKRHKIEVIDGSLLSNINFVVKEVQKANSTLIVCNHVQSAQRVYKEIKKITGLKENDIVLIHSRFCRRDRNEIEKRIREYTPKVLVSTQVVEVSLNIDYEIGFLEPAPIDAMVQRLGRINRYGKRPPANVRIFREQIEHHNLYDRKLVERSLGELASLPSVFGEPELIEAADRVYTNGYDEENESLFQQALNHRLIKNFQDSLLAGVHRDWVQDVIEKSDGTVEVLPISLLDKYRDYEQRGLRIEADDLLVPIRLKSLFGVREHIDFSDEPWKTNMSYSKEMGLELKVEVEDCFI